MQKLTKFLLSYNKFYYAIKDCINRITSTKAPLCRIELIDVKTQVVIIHHRGIETPLKLNFSEAIYDFAVLLSLSSPHACWIGYYYGKSYRESLVGKKQYSQLSKYQNFFLKNLSSRFSISSINRSGDLMYIDSKTLKTYTANPLQIAKNEYLISQFDQIQACYIGMQAGITIKNCSYVTNNRTKPILKIIN